VERSTESIAGQRGSVTRAELRAKVLVSHEPPRAPAGYSGPLAAVDVTFDHMVGPWPAHTVENNNHDTAFGAPLRQVSFIGADPAPHMVRHLATSRGGHA